MLRSDRDRSPGCTRRELLEAGAAGALLLGAGCSSRAPESSPETVAAAGEDPDPDFPLAETSLGELRDAMAEGRYTAEGVARLYLERIEALDRQGPELRSIIELDPGALATAAARDRERREGRARGPLHGIPVLLKDNIGTAGGTTTTAGSLALEGSTPSRDSEVARRLQEAGAVLLGKANLSEWANFRSRHSSSGWSARGGQCRNPYALDRNPCGSSSGSAVAVAANLVAAAVGTETNGSIVCPASANGLAGLKPTLGLVSRRGIIPIAGSQDTAGPMTRTVADAALLLGVLAGEDPGDAATLGAPSPGGGDYTRFLGGSDLGGVRLGVARDYFGFHPAVDRLMEAALADLASLGAELVDPVTLSHRQEASRASFQVLLHEFRAGIDAYLAGLGPQIPVSSLEDLIAFNRAHAEREMPYFGQDLFEEAAATGDLESTEYREALETARRLTREEGIDALLAEHRLDALVAPTGGPAWLTDLVNGDHFGGGSSSPAAIAGYPNITVPAGAVFGLPVGISFFAGAWSEPVLLRLAHAYEQATDHRRRPRLLPSVDLEAAV